MGETTVTEQSHGVVTEVSYGVHLYSVTEYKCAKCGASFLERDDNYAFCPYCGRKIVDQKE